MGYNTILVDQDGAITLVTLNRAKALNALNEPVLRATTLLAAEWQSSFTRCSRFCRQGMIDDRHN
jgi:enoyl-CoA hydratase